MPEVEEKLELRTLKRFEIIDMKAYRRRRNGKTEDKITKGQKTKRRGSPTNDRLKDGGCRELSQLELAPTKREDKEELRKAGGGIMTNRETKATEDLCFNNTARPEAEAREIHGEEHLVGSMARGGERCRQDRHDMMEDDAS